MNNLTKSKGGFTIIEVVLVLAIAGLIFLIVFLAVPALQRGQRDQQRRNDIGRAVSALQQYQSNNRGAVPADAAAMNGAFKTGYLTNGGSTFQDPTTGSDYDFVNGGSGGPADYPTPGDGQISVRRSATCGTGAFVNGGGRNMALVVKLETGGVYCQNI